MENSDNEDDVGNLEDLNEEQMDKLLQLQVCVTHFLHFSGIINTQLAIQGLTGLDDLGVCRALLESQSWDLEAVAREHLGISGLTLCLVAA